MISPSKVQHQQHRQPSRDNLDTHSHVRLQKGRKPLEKKSFYLDIKNHGLSANLEAKIKDLGGSTELFLIKSVTLVVSDRAEQFGQRNCDKGKWGYGSGGSGGPPSLRSVEVPTPIATPPTPFGGEYPLSNSTNIRGQTAQRTKSRADAMLERALTQPQQCSVDPLKNAQTWGIPIWATKKLQAWLEKIYESLRDSGNAKRNTEQSNNEKSLKVKHLKNSYIKFESFKRDTRPVFLELPLWPKLNFDGEPGTCPFDTRVRDKKVNKEESVSLLNKEKGKEMTRRPRATATRARRTEQLVAGCCEICRQDYRDLSKHVQSDKHLAFVRNDDNFLSLDKLINAGASVEAFLRANEVGQDCNLFPDGERTLHAVDLEDGKVNKSPKADLSNFAVEDIKMVQCNGARRNLNLKLSSPHNLRTRAKHESGHLLRSKGSPWHELQDKTEKFYDKFEGFTIKKRSKGTIWIEEDDNPAKKCSRLEELESTPKDFDDPDEIPRKADSPEDRLLPKLERNDLADELDDERITNIPRLEKEAPADKATVETIVAPESNSDECKNGFNGFERTPESFPESQLPGNSGNAPIAKRPSPTRENVVEDLERKEIEIVCNGLEEKKVEEEPRDEKSKLSRIGKRARGFRGRPRLSVEERLIEDNRAYYKVEVLGNKLRSSTGPWSASRTHELEPEPALPSEPKRDEPSSEKPVVVRFKRVRRSELSLLSDEAESFMFGEPKREDSSSEVSEDESSVQPRETETDWDCNNENLTIPSSPIVSSSPVKQESALPEDDSQDSVYAGRARKRRRTQTEALIKDNEDYYKFETPGSRLRFQPASPAKERPGVGPEPERLYPSKPSPEIEKMQFSFEAVPRSEPWYQTYQRQDEGAEFWHYFSEADERKPFLLPYEIENFHETLAKICQRSGSEARKKARSRLNGLGRSPRKSPRCHASTLAIMSTIIRKRENQTTNLSVVEEENSPRCSSRVATPRPEPGPAQHQAQPENPRSEVDLELREIAKSIDEMLCADPEVDDSFEAALVQVDEAPSLPKGPPPDLIELLDSCHEFYNCLENSSCASSECGEPIESPLKRRKRRKNRTGWPGIKMRKKLQNKQLLHEAFGEAPVGKKTEDEPKESLAGAEVEGESRLAEPDDEPVEARPELAHPLQCGTVSGSEDLLGTSSENSVTNDENHENLCRPDSNAQPSRGQADSKPSRKRQRPRAGSSETIDSRLEIENENDSVYVNSSMMRKNYGLAKRRRTRVVESEEAERREATSGKRSRKRQRRRGGALVGDGYEENRKDDYSAIRTAGRTSVKRRANEAVQAEDQDADLECGGLAERVSPSLMPSTEMNNRRSSMEFQPVVRMMKIEDQVEIDHSILSVTVASNRRLRSSSSPRSNAQPPAKRYKRSKGPFGRWIKNS